MTTGDARPPELFVVGSGRSGTTIVLSAIDCLEDVSAVPRLAGRVPRLTPLAAELTRRGIGPLSWRRPSSESTGLFAEAGLTQEFQIALGHSARPEDSGHLRMRRLRSRLETIRARSRAQTVVVKNTASCARVPLLAATFEQSAFLHVLRHPAHVVMSLLRTDFWNDMTLWWDGRTTEQYGRGEGLTQEEVAARHWFRQVRTARADLTVHAAGRYALLRYDEFVTQPLVSLTVLEALGLDMRCTEAERQRIERLRIRDPSGQAAIPAAVADAVEKHCGGLASDLGFVL